MIVQLVIPVLASPLDVGTGESPIARLTDGSVAWARVGSKDPGHVAVYRVRP